MRHLYILIALIAALVAPRAVAAVGVDSTLTVSLLTCSPGEETYELYGHTAILVRARHDSLQAVYNYGAFSFEQPHFVWRFVLGRTDYVLLAMPLGVFLQEYFARGSWVEEQRLNLTPAEANLLADSLAWYSLPEHCTYRYGIFRNNCTTKSRDIIENCIRGRVIYPARPRRNTFRTIIHEYTVGHPWATTGNDMLLGSDVDTLLCERDEMFAPLYMMRYADSAMVQTAADAYRPLVAERRTLLEERPEMRRKVVDAQRRFPVAPAPLAWGLLAAALGLAFCEWRRRGVVWQADAVMLCLQGVVGVVLTFMTLFSEHPGVASNWLVVAFNPLPLLFAIPVAVAARHGRRHPYHYFAAMLLALFVAAMPLMPQDFPDITLPLALTLLSRSIINIAVAK